MRPFIRVMKALSDPNRVKAMKMLGVRPLCVCEITAILGLAQPTVSKHLKILEEAGMIVSEKEKLWVNYRLNPAGSSQYCDAMLTQLESWLNETSEITEIQKLLPTINRNDICKL